MYDSKNLPLSPLKPIKKSISKLVGILLLFWIIIVAIIFFQNISKSSTEAQMLLSKLEVPGTILIIILTVIYEYLYYRTYYYQFGGQKAEIRKGVISRSTGFVQYDRLQNIYLDQDILDRLFGLYDVHYETAGEKSGFYSHVDGLDKAKADKLISFLNSKCSGSSQPHQSNDQDQSIDHKRTDDSASSSINQNQIELSRDNCDISKNEIYASSLYISLLISVMGILEVISKISSRPSSLVLIFALLLVITIFVISFVVCYVYYSIWYRNYYYSFDNERGMIRSQVLSQSVSYLYYDRIQNVNINQNIIDRIFRLFDVSIETAGEKSGLNLRIVGLNEKNAKVIQDFLLDKSKKYKKNL